MRSRFSARARAICGCSPKKVTCSDQKMTQIFLRSRCQIRMLVIEGSGTRRRKCWVHNLVIVLHLFPPRKLAQISPSPLCFCDAANVFKVCCSCGRQLIFTEAAQCNGDVNESRGSMTNKSAVAAEMVVGWIIDQAGDDRIEMDVGKEISKVLVVLDQASTIA